jgi:hypothetical protein
LKGAANDRDPSVRAAVARALEGAGPPVRSGGLYIAVEVLDKGGVPGEVLKLAESLIKEKIQAMGASLAPPGESKAQAASQVSKHNLKGYLLRTNLTPNGASGLKIEMLVMTYPDQALQGTWNVKASGGKYEAQLKAMVPRVVDNAAAELEWKQ